MAMTFVVPIVEWCIRSSPMRIHSPAWRLSLLAGGAGVLGTSLLALFVIFAIATAAEDAGANYLVSSLSGAAAALCVLATGVFGLDALQMKGQLQATLVDSYDVGSVWVVARLIVGALIFIVLSISAFRAATTNPRRSVPQRTGKEKSAASTLMSAGRPVTGAGLPRSGSDAER